MLHAEFGRHLISKLLYSIMLKEHEKGSYNFKWISFKNDILVAVGRPDLFKTEPVKNQNSMKIDISRTMSDLYIQEWNEKANVSSKKAISFI